MSNKISKRIIISLVACACIILAASFFFTKANSADIDKLPFDGADIDQSSQVYIHSDENLVLMLGGVENYEMLTRDLYVFAKTGYEKYSNQEKAVIGFKTSKISEKNDFTLIEGRFGATKNKVVVSVKSLHYGRITTSITDSVTALNIDSSLPSNSKRNQFIGVLPIEDKDFVIDYVSADDSFSVNVFNGVQSYEKPQVVLKESLGVDSLESENIIYYGVGDGGTNNNY